MGYENATRIQCFAAQATSLTTRWAHALFLKTGLLPIGPDATVSLGYSVKNMAQR